MTAPPKEGCLRRWEADFPAQQGALGPPKPPGPSPTCPTLRSLRTAQADGLNDNDDVEAGRDGREPRCAALMRAGNVGQQSARSPSAANQLLPNARITIELSAGATKRPDPCTRMIGMIRLHRLHFMPGRALERFVRPQHVLHEECSSKWRPKPCSRNLPILTASAFVWTVKSASERLTGSAPGAGGRTRSTLKFALKPEMLSGSTMLTGLLRSTNPPTRGIDATST